MRIKINGKQIKLKSSNQLTCKEYLQLITDKTGVNFISYINATSDFDFKEIQNLELKGRVLNLIKLYIGKIADINFFYKKGKPSQKFIFKNQLIDLKKETAITLGTRQAYENFTKDNSKTVYEAALFLLSIIINNIVNKQLQYDTKSVQTVYDELLNENFLNVFPSAVFFLKRLQNG